MPVTYQAGCKAAYTRLHVASEPRCEAGILLDEETESQQFKSLSDGIA